MKEQDTLHLGQAGENAVAKYVTERGMEILARNYRAEKGEIDLVVKEGETIVFLEVKTRSNLKYGTAAEAVDFRKQRVLIRTAEHFIAQYQLYESSFRFDVAEVYVAMPEYRINYIKNAFDA